EEKQQAPVCDCQSEERRQREPRHEPTQGQDRTPHLACGQHRGGTGWRGAVWLRKVVDVPKDVPVQPTACLHRGSDGHNLPVPVGARVRSRRLRLEYGGRSTVLPDWCAERVAWSRWAQPELAVAGAAAV